MHDRVIKNLLKAAARAVIAAYIFFGFAGVSSAVCTVSTTSVTFGFYDVFSPAPAISVGGITVACDDVPPRRVDVSIGQSPGSGFNPRQLKHLFLTDRLNYNLFSDSSMTVIWGDGTGSYPGVAIDRVIKNKPVTVTVYGSIPPGQDVSAGQYSDVLMVTINF